MQKSNDRLRVSPTAQMYVVNRIRARRGKGTNSANALACAMVQRNTLGFSIGDAAAADPDPISSTALKIVSFFGKLGGLFTKDPYRDLQIPAQNAAQQGFDSILSVLNTKEAQGTLTSGDIDNAIKSINKIDYDFGVFCDRLSTQYPQDRSRYQAGKSEIHNLAVTLTSGMYQHYAGHYSQSSVASNVLSTITGIFSPSGQAGFSGLPLLIMAGLAVYFVPRLMRR